MEINPFQFTGRMRRSTWWVLYFLSTAMSYFLAAAIEQVPVLALGLVPILWAFLGSTVQRLHDFGRSGWFLAAPFLISAAFVVANLVLDPAIPDAVNLGISLVIVVIWLAIALLPGDASENRYGANPRKRAREGVEEDSDMLVDLRVARGYTDE